MTSLQHAAKEMKTAITLYEVAEGLRQKTNQRHAHDTIGYLWDVANERSARGLDNDANWHNNEAQFYFALHDDNS